MVFAVRDQGDVGELEGLDELVVRGLGDTDAGALLDSALQGPVDDRVRQQIVAESRGNPLALLELPRALTPAELAFGSASPDSLPLAGRIEQGFARRLEPLPAETRRLLLVAALEPVGDGALLWRAAARLGIGTGAAAAAEQAGLIEFGTRVRFRHPLVRSATARSASPHDLQEVHRALADVTDAEQDPDRRAWHLAQAAVGPDEAVADELERSAGRAPPRPSTLPAHGMRHWRCSTRWRQGLSTNCCTPAWTSCVHGSPRCQEVVMMLHRSCSGRRSSSSRLT
jgi:hypothetical protein